MGSQGIPLASHYDLRLVFLSILISIFASYAALDLAGRVTASRGWVRRTWLAAGATGMGVGIWSMHYVGMLAFHLPVPIEYDWPTVLLSLLAAIFASAIALFLSSRRTMGVVQTIGGSVFMGGAIAGTHYIGMEAMRLPAICHYSPGIVGASVILAIAISPVALILTFHFRGEVSSGGWRKMLSAVVMGAAIPAMHYTGMMAATFTYSDSYTGNMNHSLGISSLGVTGVIVVTFMILGLAIITSVVGRSFSAQASELESTELRSRQILETSLDPFIGMDSKGNITNWNLQAENTFGWAFADAAGKGLSELAIPTSNRQVYEQNIQELFGSSGSRPPNRRFESRMTCRDGHEIPVEITISCMKSGSDFHLAAFVRDLSERESAEEKFRGLLESSSEAILFVDQNGRIGVVNAQAEKLFGYPRTELLNQNIEVLVPESLRGVHSDQLKNFFMNPKIRPMGAGIELRGRRKDGSEFPAEISLTPLKTEHGTLVSTLVLDITARKEKEEALKDAHERLGLILADVEQRAHESSRMGELLDILQSCETSEEAYRVAEACLPEILFSAGGALCLITSSRNVVEVVAQWGSLNTEMAFRPDDCWALRRGKLQYVQDANSALRCAHVSRPASDGYLCVPLAAQGETLGILYLECLPATDASTLPGSGPHQAEALGRQATAVGQRLSLALGNLRLREALRNQSIRDPLTGLFNRRYMEETLERELKRGARTNDPVSVLMLDVDHFKQFNDTFGHQAGDTLLREVGNLLIHKTRGQDVACRYGGEEFAVILSGASFKIACERADAIREGIKQLAVQYAGQVLGAVSVSIGVSAFPERASTEEVLRAADHALYRAKSEGRDRVVIDDVVLPQVNDQPPVPTVASKS